MQEVHRTIVSVDAVILSADSTQPGVMDYLVACAVVMNRHLNSDEFQKRLLDATVFGGDPSHPSAGAP